MASRTITAKTARAIRGLAAPPREGIGVWPNPQLTKPAAKTRSWANPSGRLWQTKVLRGGGTERPFSSPLNNEKRVGTFVCASCGQPLFTSQTKYDSGSGWPSFYASLPGALEFSRDDRLAQTRTEYHCARCGGHHGHVYGDGPNPTGLRFCNNGVALRFVPGEDEHKSSPAKKGRTQRLPGPTGRRVA